MVKSITTTILFLLFIAGAVYSEKITLGPPDDPYVVERDSLMRPADIIGEINNISINMQDDSMWAWITQVDASYYPLVDLYVNVYDSSGSVDNLTLDNFCVWEDEEYVFIEEFFDLPLDCATNVCLVMDVSGSMEGSELAEAKEAALQYISCMDYNDQAAIIAFSTCYSVIQEFTSNTVLLSEKIEELTAGGTTAIFDAVWAGVNETRWENGSKAVIAFSDGLENSSGSCSAPPDGLYDGFADDSTLIVNFANSCGVPIYTISVAYDSDARYLKGLAQGTDGYYDHSPDASGIYDLYYEIKTRFCKRFILTYLSPEIQQIDDWHFVEISIKDVICDYEFKIGEDYAFYQANIGPKIDYSIETKNLMNNDFPLPGEDFDICAFVTDGDTDPDSLRVELFYRMDDSVIFFSEPLVNIEDSLFCFTIDGSLTEGGVEKVEFYVTASDGQSTVSIPPRAPYSTDTVYIGCCVGTTGDANCSGGDPDISDITRLIDYLYISHAELCCLQEADANASGGQPDISDITRLIDFLYLSHAPLADCP